MLNPTINRLSAAVKRLSLAPKRLQSTQTSALPHSPTTRVTTLPNGMRVASENSDVPTCTVGLWVDAGSRYESPDNNGVSNFLEHMAFKGTSNRSQIALETQIHQMGARLDVSAAKEHIVYNAKSFASDVPTVVELLADVAQNGTFAEEDIEKQKAVILREIDEAGKDYCKVIHDYLNATGFQQTALAQNVLGTTENIQKMTRDDLVAFQKMFYRPAGMVLAAAGGVDHDKLVDLAKKHFVASESLDTYGSHQPCRFTGSEIRHRNDDLPYVHVGIAVEGVGLGHPDAIPLTIASQIIGSWDRSSTNGAHFPNPLVRRMATEGLSSGFQAFHTTYTDTGLWGVYYVTDNDSVCDCTVRVQDEIMRVCRQLSDFEVARAKNTLLTNLGSVMSGTTPICNDIGRQVLHLGKRISTEELVQSIQRVTSRDVEQCTQKYIYDQCPAVAAIGPTEALPQYIHIRAKMYKINSGIF